MEIGITHPLRAFLRWPALPDVDMGDLLFCWDANRVVVNGAPCLVLCNAATRFFSVRSMQPADWQRLDECCCEAICASLELASVPADAALAYAGLPSECTHTRTHGRRALGYMNAAVEGFRYSAQINVDEPFQAELTAELNAQQCGCATHAERGCPADWMREDLAYRGL